MRSSWRWLVVGGLVVAAGLHAASAAAQPRELPARVATLAGYAEISRATAPAWASATLRDEVGAGDAVRTAGGRLTLLTGGGQALRLAPYSQLLVAADAPAATPLQVQLDGGRLWVSVRPGSPVPAQIEVRAGSATVTVRGGGAGIAVNADGSVLVAAYHGAVTCAAPGWERALSQDQELLVPATGPLGPATKLKRGKADADWVKWNEDQDGAGGYGRRRTE
jgi:hypothetical protein